MSPIMLEVQHTPQTISSLSYVQYSATHGLKKCVQVITAVVCLLLGTRLVGSIEPPFNYLFSAYGCFAILFLNLPAKWRSEKIIRQIQASKRGFPRSSVSKKSAYGVLFRALRRFPLAPMGLPGGKRRKETLHSKASESAAHVAGCGLHLEGFSPPNLPDGFFDSLCACGQAATGAFLIGKVRLRRPFPKSQRFPLGPLGLPEVF